MSAVLAQNITGGAAGTGAVPEVSVPEAAGAQSDALPAPPGPPDPVVAPAAEPPAAPVAEVRPAATSEDVPDAPAAQDEPEQDEGNYNPMGFFTPATKSDDDQSGEV